MLWFTQVPCPWRAPMNSKQRLQRGATRTNTCSDSSLWPGTSSILHRQPTVLASAQIRSEKREVTGSTPVPTTGKCPGQGIHHFDRGFSPEVTAPSSSVRSRCRRGSTGDECSSQRVGPRFGRLFDFRRALYAPNETETGSRSTTSAAFPDERVAAPGWPSHSRVLYEPVEIRTRPRRSPAPLPRQESPTPS